MIDDKKYNPISYPVKITCKAADLISIDLLKKFQGNLKTLSDSNRDKLVKSICLKGFTAPFFVWLHDDIFNLLDGHQRCETLLYMREIGWEIPDLPVAYIEADSVKDAKSKLLAITSQYGEFNKDEVQNWIDELKDFDTELAESIRLVDEEFDLKFQDGELEETIGDDEVSEDVEPITKLGDLWELGEHRLLCGDSTDKETVEKLMNGEKADMVFTDPPYGVSYTGGLKNGKDGLESNKRDMIENDNIDLYEGAVRICNEFSNGVVFMFYADTVCYGLYRGLEAVKAEIVALLIWKKKGGYGALGASYKPNHEPCLIWKPKGKKLNFIGSTTENRVWEIDKEGINKLHPTQKPIEVPIRAISNHDAKTVLDLFGGSGSTLIACEKLERINRSMELDPHYCDVIVNRYKIWCEKNGKTPVIKLNGNIYNG